MDTNTQGQDPAQQGQDPNPNGGQDPAAQPSNPPQDGGTFDRAYVEQLRREAAQYRTELKTIREQQEAAQRKALEEQGQYQQLYTQANTELTALQQEVEQLRAFKAEQDSRIENERKALLARLPEDVRPAFETATVDQIQVVLQKLSAPGASPEGGRQPAPSRPTDPGSRAPTEIPVGQPGWLNRFTKT